MNEQVMEDLHFLSDRGNYKSIKYALECIEKLEKIEQIVNDWKNGEIQDTILAFHMIKEVLENE